VRTTDLIILTLNELRVMKTLVKLLYCSGSEDAQWYTLAYSDWYPTRVARSLEIFSRTFCFSQRYGGLLPCASAGGV